MQTPLAERIRPQNLDQLVGQEHLTGPGSILRVSVQKEINENIFIQENKMDAKGLRSPFSQKIF